MKVITSGGDCFGNMRCCAGRGGGGSSTDSWLLLVWIYIHTLIKVTSLQELELIWLWQSFTLIQDYHLKAVYWWKWYILCRQWDQPSIQRLSSTLMNVSMCHVLIYRYPLIISILALLCKIAQLGRECSYIIFCLKLYYLYGVKIALLEINPKRYIAVSMVINNRPCNDLERYRPNVDVMAWLNWTIPPLY